ncbi:MAG: PLDc N-terminal domain-containing protein, partial [Rhodospirillales bacterium]|nr:PLDc N-terminal domain-containing protein [Rhodospirillales bacterium]
MEGLRVQGLFGLIVLVLDVWAIINVVQSNESMMKKAIWVVVILLLPLLGF